MAVLALIFAPHRIDDGDIGQRSDLRASSIGRITNSDVNVVTEFRETLEGFEVRVPDGVPIANIAKTIDFHGFAVSYSDALNSIENSTFANCGADENRYIAGELFFKEIALFLGNKCEVNVGSMAIAESLESLLFEVKNLEGFGYDYLVIQIVKGLEERFILVQEFVKVALHEHHWTMFPDCLNAATKDMAFVLLDIEFDDVDRL